MSGRAALRPAGRAGFTMIEVVVVLALVAIALTITMISFSGYFQRVSAQRAAQLFAQDLTLARMWSVRSREPVVIRFYEASLWYEVETEGTATELARRRFGVDADINLSSLDLGIAGDSVVFDARGIADLSGAGGSLGTATFSSGAVAYTVSFNSMGASKIDRT